MIIRNILLTMLSIALISSCNQKKNITTAKDYNPFLNPVFLQEKLITATNEVLFWKNRLAADTTSYINKLELASQYLHLFKLNGDVSYLHKGDSLLKAASTKVGNKIPEILYSISQSSIGQHQFTDAALCVEAAKKAEGDPYAIALLKFDVSMELGNYAEALSNLKKIKDPSSFDYLIRKAKWEDYKGNLDGAIKLMETAFEKIKNKKTSLYCWALSNLADMYTHAGKLPDAYKAYLNVLKKDSANLYCLKGIARIAWLNDNNTKEAKRIINFILSQTAMPDLKIELAEILAMEGNEKEGNEQIHSFVNTVTKPIYGAMYNKYLIDLFNNDLKNPSKAILLSQLELKNRTTPEVYNWLAWSYYNNGQLNEAYKIASTYVLNKTFEPDALVNTAFIYAAVGKKQEAKKLFTESLESSFELGPSVMKKVKEAMVDL